MNAHRDHYGLCRAGSGKTRVITSRIAYLINKKGVAPDNILAVTFTKKAAGEMQERIKNILCELGHNVEYLPMVGTFHSIGAIFLRHNAKAIGYASNFSIYDSDDSENLIKELMLERQIDIKQIKPKVVSYFISSAKNEMISPETFSTHYSGYIEDIVADVYPDYQKQLRIQNAVDFGDLLYLTVKMFEENEDILKQYQDRISIYLLTSIRIQIMLSTNLQSSFLENIKYLCCRR